MVLSDRWLDDLNQAFDERADPDKAPAMAAYTKHRFEYIGLAAGERRQASKPVLAAAKTMDPDDLLELAETLWAEPEREFHYVGMDALRAGAKNLRADDLEAVRGFIVATPWWDTVDSLAIHTVGPLVANHDLAPMMDVWVDSSDIWIARSAILHQLMYKDETDTVRLFGYCAKRAQDTEFFIRKAIGWALRQYGRTDPEAVKAFVVSNDEVLSGLSKREALKHLG